MTKLDIKKELLSIEIYLHDIRIELQSIEEIKKELAGVCRYVAKLREDIK
jgi:hypothetical protein